MNGYVASTAVALVHLVLWTYIAKKLYEKKKFITL